MLKGQARTDYMREYMRKRRAAGKQSQPDTTALESRIRGLEAELAQERTKREAVEAELARAKNKPQPPPQPSTREEWEAAKQATTEARSKQRKEAAAAKAAKLTAELEQAGPVTVESLTAELVKKDARIKSVQTENKNLKMKLNALSDLNTKLALNPNARKIMMPKWLHRQAMAYLHPDRLEQLLKIPPDEIAAERKRVEKVSQAFNALNVEYPDGA